MSGKFGQSEAAYSAAMRFDEAAPHSSHDRHAEQEIPAMARHAVETFVREGIILHYEPSPMAAFLLQPAACFVSIKTVRGELRGCIGTIEPAYSTLGEEIIYNALQAATRDPRFLPIKESELPALRFSVDVLSPPEETRFENLDPSVFGVIVEDVKHQRRGLLLPDIEGIVTPNQQVEIALRKAGIAPDAPLRLYRFRVTRFPEHENFISSQKE
jgi:AmmeMemoRadiSam system protein A